MFQSRLVTMGLSASVRSERCSATRIYDRRHTKPEESPVFRIKY